MAESAAAAAPVPSITVTWVRTVVSAKAGPAASKAAARAASFKVCMVFPGMRFFARGTSLTAAMAEKKAQPSAALRHDWAPIVTAKKKAAPKGGHHRQVGPALSLVP